MQAALYVAAFAVVVLILSATGFLFRTGNGRHRQRSSWPSCRCGHLVLAHADNVQACELCTCAAFRKGRFQDVSQTALDWVK